MKVTPFSLEFSSIKLRSMLFLSIKSKYKALSPANTKLLCISLFFDKALRAISGPIPEGSPGEIKSGHEEILISTKASDLISSRVFSSCSLYFL